jgi:hypothetical protein
MTSCASVTPAHDKDEGVGTVHVVDIVQTDDKTGERGGYRLGLVVVLQD